MIRFDSRGREVRALKRRRPRPPLPLPPTEADRGYSRVLRLIVEDLRKEFLQAMEPAYKASLLEYQRQVLPEAMREDDAIDRVKRASERALIEWNRKWTIEELELIAERTGQLVEDVVDKSVSRQWKRVLGLDPLLPKSRLEALLKFKAQENARLITSLPDRQIAQIENGIIRFMQSGERWEAMARFIEERFDVMQTQAELIARDQVGKMYSAFTQARHQELGVEEYIWQTSGDERVRDSHRELDGKKFRYDDPPIVDGEAVHPGQPIRCRCVAIPILPE